MERSSGCDAYAAFITGLFVGAVGALLLAPQSGKESRVMLGEMASRIKERMVEAKQDLMQKTGEAQRHDSGASQIGRVTEPL